MPAASSLTRFMAASILAVWANDNVNVFEWLESGEAGEQPKFNFDPRKYLGPARTAVKDMITRKLHVLGAAVRTISN